MAKLTIMRGLPGSGKSTWAKAQPDAWRVSRDDLRGMRNGVWDFSNSLNENLITLVQRQLIAELLDRDLHVIVDDTNLNWRHVQELLKLATGRHGGVLVEVGVKEFLHVPLQVCIERDALRPYPVGDTVILEMYGRYMGSLDG